MLKPSSVTQTADVNTGNMVGNNYGSVTGDEALAKAQDVAKQAQDVAKFAQEVAARAQEETAAQRMLTAKSQEQIDRLLAIIERMQGAG